MLFKLSEVIIFAAMTVVSIALWFTADALPVSKRYAQVDSDLWPKLVFGALAVCCAIHFAQKVAGLRSTPTATEAMLKGAVPAGYHRRLVITGALVLGYFFALQYIGFLFATLIFLWAAAWILPYRSIVAKLAFAPVFTLLLGAFFNYGLSLSLPRGTGVFYDLSQALF